MMSSARRPYDSLETNSQSKVRKTSPFVALIFMKKAEEPQWIAN
jgi:hypothetical protein